MERACVSDSMTQGPAVRKSLPRPTGTGPSSKGCVEFITRAILCTRRDVVVYSCGVVRADRCFGPGECMLRTRKRVVIFLAATALALAGARAWADVDVGERLARWALAKDYGRKDVAYAGQGYRGVTVSDGAVVLSFDHAEGLTTKDGAALTCFTIAGSDRKFVPAKAEIRGQTVVVSSP